MQVHSNDMITSSDSKHVRNKLGSDRSSRLVLFVHSRVGVAWDDGCNTPRRGASASRDDDEELHQVVVHIVAGGLDNEDVLFSNGLGDFHVYLAIGEFFDGAGCQGHIEPAKQVIGQMASSSRAASTARTAPEAATHRSATVLASSG